MPLFRSIFIHSALLLVLNGCQTTRPVPLCESQFERWESDVDAARIALRPWVKELPAIAEAESPKSGRSPASLFADPIPPALDAGPGVLDLMDREAWSRWAVHRLEETQHRMDEAGLDPGNAVPVRLLSALADQYVFFHGHAETGNVRRMMIGLDRIESATEKARAAFCRR